MAIQGFCPPPSPPSHSPYYQLLERGSARLGRVKKRIHTYQLLCLLRLQNPYIISKLLCTHSVDISRYLLCRCIKMEHLIKPISPCIMQSVE